MKNSDYNNDVLLKLLNGQLSDEESRAWSQNEEFKADKAILDEVDTWTLPELDVSTSYEKLKSRRTPTKVIAWYQSNAFRIAASLLLLASVYFLFFVNQSLVSYETQVAETENITLPDNSNVSLAASSSLSYDKDVWENRREVKLEGTGYFEVTKDSSKPFEVTFDKGSVVVLGTAFEVKSRDGYSSVSCYEGKVSVTIDNKETILTKGQGVQIGADKQIKTFEHSKSWSAEIVRFESAPLSAVFSSLSAQFGVEVNTSNIDVSRTFSGTYTTKNIDLALLMICEPMDISYEKNGNSVVLQ